MRSILVLFDSLSRRALSCYGGAVPTPNFDRLAARSTTFDSHFAGSLPCMPARRDLMTGRLNFLHRSWGPLEPFDIPLTALMAEKGVYSHLVTDHYHYFENGGATYHTAFTTWDFLRGQEADPWVAQVDPPLDTFRQIYAAEQFEDQRGGYRLQGMLNRTRIRETPEFPSVRTFDEALAFLDANRQAGDWFLQLEVFDPHEPFHAPPEYRAAFLTAYDGPIRDWPRYRSAAGDDPVETAEMRANYAALVALCDAQLGRLLDRMDALAMWDDTALIVTSDHGFLLGEHDWWGKNRMPFFNEIAHLPLFLHVPGRQAGGRSAALSQTIDVMATLLDLHGIAAPDVVQGRSLLPALDGGVGREIALYGVFGGAINATDGRYTHFRYPPDMEAAPLFEYTLMPQHSGAAFTVAELRGAELHPGFGFTQGVPVLKIRAMKGAKRPPMQGGGFDETASVLYDLSTDPGQLRPLDDPATLLRLTAAIRAEMERHEAPPELYTRFALATP
ncbi:MAG: sulfatase [Pseudorhodobacter sp.]